MLYHPSATLPRQDSNLDFQIQNLTSLPIRPQGKAPVLCARRPANPVKDVGRHPVHPAGLEPATYRLRVEYSAN